MVTDKKRLSIEAIKGISFMRRGKFFDVCVETESGKITTANVRLEDLHIKTYNQPKTYNSIKIEAITLDDINY